MMVLSPLYTFEPADNSEATRPFVKFCARSARVRFRSFTGDMISFAPAGEGMQGPSARLDEGGYLNVHPQEPVEMKGMLCHGDACKLDRWVRISIFDAVYL